MRRRPWVLFGGSMLALAAVVGTTFVALGGTRSTLPEHPFVERVLIGTPAFWPSRTGAGVSSAAWADARHRTIGVLLSGSAAAIDDARCRERIVDVARTGNSRLTVHIAAAREGREPGSACEVPSRHTDPIVFTAIVAVPRGLDTRGDVEVDRIHVGRTNVYERALVSTATATGLPAAAGRRVDPGVSYFLSAGGTWLRAASRSDRFRCAPGLGTLVVRDAHTLVLDERQTAVVLASLAPASAYRAHDTVLRPEPAVLTNCVSPLPYGTTSVPLPVGLDTAHPIRVVVLDDRDETPVTVTSTTEN